MVCKPIFMKILCGIMKQNLYEDGKYSLQSGSQNDVDIDKQFWIFQSGKFYIHMLTNKNERMGDCIIYRNLCKQLGLQKIAS